jgi:hypothetical protein
MQTVWGRKGVYRVLVWNPEGQRSLQESGKYWRIILRWVFGRWDIGVWTE